VLHCFYMTVCVIDWIWHKRLINYTIISCPYCCTIKLLPAPIAAHCNLCYSQFNLYWTASPKTASWDVWMIYNVSICCCFHTQTVSVQDAVIGKSNSSQPVQNDECWQEGKFKYIGWAVCCRQIPALLLIWALWLGSFEVILPTDMLGHCKRSYLSK